MKRESRSMPLGLFSLGQTRDLAGQRKERPRRAVCGNGTQDNKRVYVNADAKWRPLLPSQSFAWARRCLDMPFGQREIFSRSPKHFPFVHHCLSFFFSLWPHFCRRRIFLAPTKKSWRDRRANDIEWRPEAGTTIIGALPIAPPLAIPPTKANAQCLSFFFSSIASHNNTHSPLKTTRNERLVQAHPVRRRQRDAGPVLRGPLCASG